MDFDDLSRRRSNAPPIEVGDAGMTPDEIESLYQSSDVDDATRAEREALVTAIQTYIRARMEHGTSGRETLIVPVARTSDDIRHVVRP